MGGQRKRLIYDPESEELPLFELLFFVSNAANTGSIITNEEARETLSLSCLPDDVVRMIINMTADDDANYLDRKQFYAAVRLVQLRQNRVSVKNLTLTVPSDVQLNPPYFRGITGPVADTGNYHSAQIDLTTHDELSLERSSKYSCAGCNDAQKEIETLRKMLKESTMQLKASEKENVRLKQREGFFKASLRASGMNEAELLANNKKSENMEGKSSPSSVFAMKVSEFSAYKNFHQSDSVEVMNHDRHNMHRRASANNKDLQMAISQLRSRSKPPRRKSTMDSDFEKRKKITEFGSRSFRSFGKNKRETPMTNNFEVQHNEPVNIQNVPKNLHIYPRQNSILSDITESIAIQPNFDREFEFNTNEIFFEKKQVRKNIRSLIMKKTKSIKSMLT